MGLDLVYSDGKSQHSLRFTDSEWYSITKFAEFAPTSTNLLFEVSGFGTPATVESVVMITALQQILELLKERPTILPATYQFRMENFMGTGLPGDWTGGAASGIRLPDDKDHYYFIDARNGGCWLERHQQVDGKMVSRENIGHLKYLDTETCGRVHFRRRSSGRSLINKLDTLHAFLETASGRQIIKVLA